jgi:hypothetical protein
MMGGPGSEQPRSLIARELGSLRLDCHAGLLAATPPAPVFREPALTPVNPVGRER